MKLLILKKKQNRFIANLVKSQVSQLRNTLLLESLERKRELFLYDSLPGLNVKLDQQELAKVNTEIKKVVKYLMRSQKAIIRNTGKISRLENKIRLLTSPKLNGF